MNDPRILVDHEDAWLLEKYKWTVTRRGYAVRSTAGRDGSGKRKTILLHRVVLDAPNDMDVDHINGNGLDNRRCNLRLATTSQNVAHKRLSSNNTSGRKGVTWSRQKGKWRAEIMVSGRHLNLGLFVNLDAAARAYDRAALEIFGEFALTNEAMGFNAVEVTEG